MFKFADSGPGRGDPAETGGWQPGRAEMPSSAPVFEPGDEVPLSALPPEGMPTLPALPLESSP